MYGILIYDGVEPIDIGATFGVLSMASRIIPDLKFAGISADGGEVVCASGLRVAADYSIDDAIPDLTDLIVTGGPGWVDVASDERTLEFLRTTNARVSAICTGAMILQAAGRLEGRRATTKREVFDGEKAPLDLLSTQNDTKVAVIVDDGDVVTSGGVTLGIDAMFYCLARSHGADKAKQVARVMEYSRALEANRSALGYA